MSELLALCSIGGMMVAYETLDYLGSRQIKNLSERLKCDEGLKNTVREFYIRGMIEGPHLGKVTLPKGIFTYFAGRSLGKQLKKK